MCNAYQRAAPPPPTPGSPRAPHGLPPAPARAVGALHPTPRHSLLLLPLHARGWQRGACYPPKVAAPWREALAERPSPPPRRLRPRPRPLPWCCPCSHRPRSWARPTSAPGPGCAHCPTGTPASHHAPSQLGPGTRRVLLLGRLLPAALLCAAAAAAATTGGLQFLPACMRAGTSVVLALPLPPCPLPSPRPLPRTARTARVRPLCPLAPHPSQIAPRLPPLARDLVAKMLVYDPTQRCGS